MNALLIYPEFPDTFWSFKHALKFLGKRAAQPPLGLMTVAALLPTAWKKRLVDTNVERLRDRDLDWADVVLLSGDAHPARVAGGHRGAVPRARPAHGGGRADRQQPVGGRAEGGSRGDRRGGEPDCRSGAGSGSRERPSRSTRPRNGRRWRPARCPT